MAPEKARATAGRLAAAFAFATFAAAPAHALRLIDYNVLNYPGTTAATRNPLFRTILSPLAGDILVTEEQTSQSGVDQYLNIGLRGDERRKLIQTSICFQYDIC